jgi:hypothetical protein
MSIFSIEAKIIDLAGTWNHLVDDDYFLLSILLSLKPDTIFHEIIPSNFLLVTIENKVVKFLFFVYLHAQMDVFMMNFGKI